MWVFCYLEPKASIWPMFCPDILCRPPAARGYHFCGLSQVLFADMKPSPLTPSPNTGKVGDQNAIWVEHTRGTDGGLQALTSVDRVLNVKGADEMSNANTFEFSTEDRSPFLLQLSKILFQLLLKFLMTGSLIILRIFDLSFLFLVYIQTLSQQSKKAFTSRVPSPCKEVTLSSWGGMTPGLVWGLAGVSHSQMLSCPHLSISLSDPCDSSLLTTPHTFLPHDVLSYTLRTVMLTCHLKVVENGPPCSPLCFSLPSANTP